MSVAASLTIASLTEEASSRLSALRGRHVVGEVLEVSRSRNGGRWVQLADHTAEITMFVPRARLRGANLSPEVGNVPAVTVEATSPPFRSSWYWTARWVERTDETGPITHRMTQEMDELVARGVIDPTRRPGTEIVQPESAAGFPRLQRIIVLTSGREGAGCGDLRIALSPLLRDRVVERYVSQPGTTMVKGCVEALSRLALGEADLLVITRGGGGRDDLRQFDAPELACAIHACPIPVVKAVGHAHDVSLADRAALAAFRTPTSAAHFLNRAYWQQQPSRPRRVPPASGPTGTITRPDHQAAPAVESLKAKLRLLDDDYCALQSGLTTMRLARDDVWTSLDTHLVAAASGRVRRRSAALSLLALAVTIGVILTTLAGPSARATEWLVSVSIVGAVAAVGALYLSHGPRRALRSASSRDVRRQAVTGDEWIRRMSSASSPRELRTLLSRRPR